MDQILEGIEGATAIIMDDILIPGSNIEHHDAVLHKAIERATSYNLTLNLQKCVIRQPPVPYIGHLLTSEGLKPDPLVAAVRTMLTPKNKDEVKRFLGFVTYLEKFIPNLSELSAPLRKLLTTDALSDWQPAQEEAFLKLKEQCCSQPVLKHFDVKEPVETQCDASQHGFGVVFIQGGQPIAYSSLYLTDIEGR